jgi:hypothetical protein
MRGTRQSDGARVGLASFVTAIPTGVVLLLMAVLCLSELGDAVRWPFLADGRSSRVVLAGVVGAGLVVVVLRTRSRDDDQLPRHVGLLPFVPFVVMVGYAVSSAAMSLPRRLEWFLGGDHVRHLIYVAEERSLGYLDYADVPYPRAWHSLMALLWSSTGSDQDPAGFVTLAQIMAMSVWLLYAVLALATAQLAVALARRCGLGDRAVGLSGLAAGALTLWPTYLSNYQALGFETSILGALLLAVAARRVLTAPTGMGTLVVTTSCVALMAHVWQLLLPAAAVPVLFAVRETLVSDARRRRSGDRGTTSQVGVVAVLAAGAVVAAPGILAVVTQFGLSHATVSDVVAPVPWGLLPAALAAGLLLAWRFRADRAVVVVVAMVVLTALSALLLAAAYGLAPTKYYPSKLLWNAGALGLPLLGVGLAGLTEGWGGDARPPLRTLTLLARTVGGLVLAVCLVNPAFAFVGHWSTADGNRVLDTVTTPGAQRAQVVWLGDQADDTIARVFLDFYRAGHTSDRTPQPPLSVPQECDLLRASAQPLGISNQPVDAVRQRYSCVPQTGVMAVAPRRP